MIRSRPGLVYITPLWRLSIDSQKAERSNPLVNAMIERRRTLRLYEPISLAVKGERGMCDRPEFETIVRDISGGGLCAIAPRILSAGDRLSFVIRFARAGTRPFLAPTITTRGVVRRVQNLSDGTFLFAATFIMRRIM
jgi:c-di-GMP-binding flagellar brake protein YcgR